MENQNVFMPVNKMSYSGLTQLLRNPIIFKMKYILKIYDTPSSASAMIGQAAHKALEFRYTDREQPIHEVIKVGMDFLVETSDAYIDYGKTGSREQMLKDYNQVINFYFAEEPNYNKILFVEEKWEAECKSIYGDVLPIMLTGKPDLVHQYTDNPEDVEIIDTKFVTSFTDYETEDYVKIIQAMFLYHLLLATKGIKAKRMKFREVKKSKNKDGTEQIRDWALPFNHEPYFVIFYNILNDAVKYLKNDPVFLPNLSDLFDGEQAGLIYAQGLINADMSDVEVMHKVRDVALTSKKFITSKLDAAENAHLLPDEKIKICLAEFGIPVEPVETQEAANVILYKFKVSRGIRMSTVEKHKADIARAIEAKSGVRILAPIPGTDLVGVEVSREDRQAVTLNKTDFHKGTLDLPIGVGIDGKTVFLPLNDAPHLLIAGATGSGKSMLLHAILTSLTKQMTPKEMELILIDPKRVELVAFEEAPHLRTEIINENIDAQRALKELCSEMDYRFDLLKSKKVRNITEYNATVKSKDKLKYIVVVIDEFADLMSLGKDAHKKEKAVKQVKMEQQKALAKKYAETYEVNENSLTADSSTEELVNRLARLARAAGIHLIIATQRPSVDVITGTIKSNFPTRIALSTSSPTDSQVILGETGAERLNGKGDLLLLYPALKGITRLQGFYVK